MHTTMIFADTLELDTSEDVVINTEEVDLDLLLVEPRLELEVPTWWFQIELDCADVFTHRPMVVEFSESDHAEVPADFNRIHSL